MLRLRCAPIGTLGRAETGLSRSLPLIWPSTDLCASGLGGSAGGPPSSGLPPLPVLPRFSSKASLISCGLWEKFSVSQQSLAFFLGNSLGFLGFGFSGGERAARGDRCCSEGVKPPPKKVRVSAAFQFLFVLLVGLIFRDLVARKCVVLGLFRLCGPVHFLCGVCLEALDQVEWCAGFVGDFLG